MLHEQEVNGPRKSGYPETGRLRSKPRFPSAAAVQVKLRGRTELEVAARRSGKSPPLARRAFQSFASRSIHENETAAVRAVGRMSTVRAVCAMGARGAVCRQGWRGDCDCGKKGERNCKGLHILSSTLLLCSRRQIRSFRANRKAPLRGQPFCLVHVRLKEGGEHTNGPIFLPCDQR
jgi:hypothetical protein